LGVATLYHNSNELEYKQMSKPEGEIKFYEDGTVIILGQIPKQLVAYLRAIEKENKSKHKSKSKPRK